MVTSIKIDDTMLRPLNNNFTFVRLFLGSSVIFSHAYWRLSGQEGYDGLSHLLGKPVSNFAVDGFFFLSGFLIYGSSVRRNHLGSFLAARFTRLWPGLAISVLATVVFGAFVSQTSGLPYFRSETLRFILRNLLLQGGAYRLTGVACGAELCNINGSLWTIAWEVRCYVILALLMLLKLNRPGLISHGILPVSILFCLMWQTFSTPDTPLGYFGDMIARLWTLFALGMGAFVLRARIDLSWPVLAALIAAAGVLHRVAEPFAIMAEYVATGYGVLCLGLLTARWNAFSASWPDLSYGIYIYAFPVMMLSAGAAPFTNPLVLTLATFALTMPVAALSWYAIEKPALSALRRWERAPSRSPIDPSASATAGS